MYIAHITDTCTCYPAPSAHCRQKKCRRRRAVLAAPVLATFGPKAHIPGFSELLRPLLACHLSSTPDSRSEATVRLARRASARYREGTLEYHRDVEMRYQKPFASQPGCGNRAPRPFFELRLAALCSLPSLPCRLYITCCISTYILSLLSMCSALRRIPAAARARSGIQPIPYHIPAQIVWRSPATFLLCGWR